MRKIEIISQFNRPLWTTIDHQQHDFELCAIVRRSKLRFTRENKLDIEKKILTPYKDLHRRVQEKRKNWIRRIMGEAHDKKNIHVTQYIARNSRRSLTLHTAHRKKKDRSTMMAVSDRKRTKTHRTQTIRKPMDK
jgi:hypothetical protein